MGVLARITFESLHSDQFSKRKKKVGSGNNSGGSQCLPDISIAHQGSACTKLEPKIKIAKKKFYIYNFLQFKKTSNDNENDS